MSTQTQIERLTTDRNIIRAKMIALGLGTSTDNLDKLAEEIDSIVDRGGVSAEIKEGETYTVPAGYHNGTGTVKGIAGGGHYTLQAKSGIVPTKALQSVTPDEGYYGLSSVGISPIPDIYQDVSGVTATASDVLVTKTFVPAGGTLTAGTMANNGAIARTLTVDKPSVNIPIGYHNGSGEVNISLEEKTVTPTVESQAITPSTGKVISRVTVNAIPKEFANTSDATIQANEILSGEIGYSYDQTEEKAIKVIGSMPNNGEISGTLDTTNTSKIIPAGYTSGGSVIINLEEKETEPTEDSQVITSSSGKVISKVTVNRIPVKYADTSTSTVKDENLLSGVIAFGYDQTEKKAVKLTGSMPNNGSQAGILDTETTSKTIPSGYTTGGEIKINLEEKETTPTESTQIISPSSEKVLSKVTVNRIPVKYADTSDASATESKILFGETAYGYSSTENKAVKIIGSMPNNGEISGTLDVSNTSKSIPSGYASGGSISINLEEKEATPSESTQNIVPSSGKVLSKVTVNPIPNNYKDTTGTDAVASNILSGKKAVNTTGTITGSMANRGEVTATLTGLGVASGDCKYIIAEGYYAGGSVSITSDIERALEEI